MTTTRFDIRRITPAFIAASLVALLLAYLELRGVSLARVIKAAAGFTDNTPAGAPKKDPTTIGDLVNAINGLLTPLTLAALAATPLAIIGGAVAMAFGSRQGMNIVITAIGVTVLIVTAKGVVS